MLQNISAWGTLAGTIATAIATFFLWPVTRILAVETKRMADAAARPQVIAKIVPNQWPLLHLDINVQNTGNATAFDIEIMFEPPLEREGVVPLQRVSVLKPNELVQSYFRDVDAHYLDKSFIVTVIWKNDPHRNSREVLSYSFNMPAYKDLGNLGASDPVYQIADEMKKLREDWQKLATGTKRLRVELTIPMIVKVSKTPLKNHLGSSTRNTPPNRSTRQRHENDLVWGKGRNRGCDATRASDTAPIYANEPGYHK